MGDGTGAVSAVGLESFVGDVDAVGDAVVVVSVVCSESSVGGVDALGDALGAVSAIDSESFVAGSDAVVVGDVLFFFCVASTTGSESLFAGGDASGEATGDAIVRWR